jgi:aldehyde:ferredoxin oxidoreductase
MYGYAGQVLRLDLSHAKLTREPLPENDAKKYLGGRGIAAKILFDELERGIDPLGPKNKIVLATGPFAATGYPLNSRWLVAGS